MDMNFVIFPPSATFHGVGYSERKQKKGMAQLLHFDNFGHYQDGRENITKAEFETFLKRYSSRNKRTKNAQFHATMTCKGKRFSHEELKEKTLLVMEKLGYGGIPILIYGHDDTKNNHVHIVTSRIGLDGKKINHNLEGVRANKILADILKLHTKDILQNDIAKALAYDFSTVSQFNMLMEISGYTLKDNLDYFEYFKHGTTQGKVDKITLEQKIKDNLLLARKSEQLKAIIAKYAAIYSTEIKLNDASPYSSADRFFESDLTKFLKEKFGYEFRFFTGKGQAKPYGYAIVDHRNKTVYRGSEIYKLQDLISLGQNFNNWRKANPKNALPLNSTTLLKIEDIGYISDVIKNDGYENSSPEKATSQTYNIDIVALLALHGEKIDSSAALAPKRKKKRRNNLF